MRKAFRACYFMSSDRQSELLLTSEEQADFDDEALVAAAVAEGQKEGLDFDDGFLVVGWWKA